MANDLIKQVTEIELMPEPIDTDNRDCLSSFPVSELASLGVAFEPLTQAVQYITSGGKAAGLYKVTLPEGATHLASFNSGVGNLGTAMGANNQIVGQAVLNPVVCNPAMICMAVALMNIDQKLDAIQKIQKEMMDFLAQKERSELKGDLRFLWDIMNSYKFNYNIDDYKKNSHMKVLDIKQNAERKIDFYKERISNKLKKHDLVHRRKDARKQIKEVEELFKDFQLAEYLYAFSSFLEVMLLENYNKDYLKSITDKIEKYSYLYRELYTKSYDEVERYSSRSLESHLMGGASIVSKGMGQVIEKVPVISRTQIDENLQRAGKALKEKKKSDVDRMMSVMIDQHNSQTKPFVDNINMISKLYNEPLEIVFDDKNVYIPEV